MIYECTICGQGATLWTGTVFDQCSSYGYYNIMLRHSRFGSGLHYQCNEAVVISTRIGTSLDVSGSQCYISQLIFQINTTNETIACLYDYGISEITIGKVAVFISGIHINYYLQSCMQYYALI